MAFLGISMHFFQKQILPACQECCSCCLCKVCSSLEQKKGYERAITGSRIILTCPLLSSLGHLGVQRATSIQTFDFSTLYTSIPHDLLKSRMNNIINNAFKHKIGATRYTHFKAGRNKSYFTGDPLNCDNKYTANDICRMTEFLVDNIYVRFGGQIFQQMVGIPMGTNCAPLLSHSFLYPYENELLDKLIKVQMKCFFLFPNLKQQQKSGSSPFTVS